MAKKKKHLHVDPELDAMVKQLAAELGVPESQIWNYFTAEGLLDVQDESSGIWNRLTGSSSNRYRHNLDYDDLIDKLSGDDT